MKCRCCGKELKAGEQIFRLEPGFAYCKECGNRIYTQKEQWVLCFGFGGWDPETQGYTIPLIDKYRAFAKTATIEEKEQAFGDSFVFWTDYDPEIDD